MIREKGLSINPLYSPLLDLILLHKLLHENFKELTRWEVYKAEVESGRLQWGIVHTEKFFKENARLMEGSEGDFNIVKKLIRLVAASPDDDVTAIACFDLGEFARHYPSGKAIATRLGAKDLVMKMIEHENPEVQRNALLCVSKMLVQNWAVSGCVLAKLLPFGFRKGQKLTCDFALDFNLAWSCDVVQSVDTRIS